MRGRLHSIVGAGVLLLAVSACAGQQEDVGFGGEPPPKPPPGPVEPKPVEQRQEVAGDQVKSESDDKVWTQNNGTVVVTTGTEGGCSEVHAETTEQTDKQVTIVLVDETPEPAGACTMDIRHPTVATKLDAPLKDRTVVVEEKDVKVPKQ